MRVTSLSVKQFRCFDQLQLSFSGQLVLIDGVNGVGKTSLLEALHYACYLRSFRTHVPRELIQFGKSDFFIKMAVQADQGIDEIQVGFSGVQRLVKHNSKSIQSFKELMDVYRVVTITEDGLLLIKGGPEVRRRFLDQSVLLFDPTVLSTMKRLSEVVHARNALLAAATIDMDVYAIWTSQLESLSAQLRTARTDLLERLSSRLQVLVDAHFPEYRVSLTYEQKHAASFEQERRFSRSLYGAHLDDVLIQFQDRRSKTYASRGQQKLVMFLVYIAYIQELLDRRGSVVVLLDDFMTDFDAQRVELLFELLRQLPVQLVITTPHRQSFLHELAVQAGAQLVHL